MKLSHASLIYLSGLVWLIAGSFLLPFGLNLLMNSALNLSSDSVGYPVLSFLTNYTGGSEQAATVLTAICLLIGYLKGTRVLSKSVHRSVKRIESFPNPTSLANIYSKGYYLLFLSMFGIGFLIKFFEISSDIRGAVDIAVGVALINGAMLYFREARKLSLVRVKK